MIVQTGNRERSKLMIVLGGYDVCETRNLRVLLCEIF